MLFVGIVRWIGSIAGLGALLLGLLFWIANIDFIGIHMLLGITVALSLLLLGLVALSAKGLRGLGAVGVIYALIVPVFGLTQDRILDTSAHWVIQAAHLLVGIGALALIGIISTRYQRLKRAANNSAALGGVAVHGR
ncbi:MAG TPA: hypothetical protein VFU32_04230 [Ktedonobacterales bacterium]|nr:hypothetical protein [Ktedonobacterales bacterium]